MQKRMVTQSVWIGVMVVAMSLFMLTPAMGQEKNKTEATVFGVFTTMHQMKLDDVEGHTMSLYESRGVGLMKDGGFTFSSKGTSDLVKGTGTHHGTQKNIDKDGDIWLTRWQGKVYPMKTDSGKPTLGFEGTWTYVGGSGKWEGVEGSGTYKGMLIGDVIYKNDVVGETMMKK